MKNLIFHFLSFFEIYLSELISKKKLEKFLRKLQPYQTNYPLIRFGNNNDGGYLIPNDLKNLNFCFSCGVGRDISFELGLLSKKIKSYFADGTVDSLPMNHKNFKFIKKNISHISTSKDFSINEFIKNKVKGEDYILKLDIEGHEYKTIIDLEKKYLKEARIIVIEFHFMHRILRNYYYDFIEYCFDKILDSHLIVHVHPNNDAETKVYKGTKIFSVLEITFLRKDRILSKKKTVNYTHPLDCQTNPNKKELFIPDGYFN